MKVIVATNSRSWMEEHKVVYSTKTNKIIGEIQRMHLGFSASQGGEPSVYLASQRGRNYGIKACSTEMEAYHFLGISTKEVDEYYEVVVLDKDKMHSKFGTHFQHVLYHWLKDNNFPLLHNKKFYYNGSMYYVYSCSSEEIWKLEEDGHYYFWEKAAI